MPTLTEWREVAIVWTLVALGAALLLAADTPPHVVIATFEEASVTTDAVGQVLREAYAQLGIQLSIQYLPGERALAMANRGDVDGDLCRIEGIERRYPNLLPVPVPVFDAELVVSTTGLTFPVAGFASLAPYAIGYTRGLKVVEMNVPKGARTQPADSLELGLAQLLAGRTDLFIDDRTSIVAASEIAHLSSIKILEPPIARFQLYHFIHKKHRALLAPLTAALKAMQKKGTIRGLRERVVRDWQARKRAKAP